MPNQFENINIKIVEVETSKEEQERIISKIFDIIFESDDGDEE